MEKPQITVYTELTFKMAKYLEVHYRLGVAALNAISKATSTDIFLVGAFLRMLADTTANVFIVNCMSYALKEKFIDYWMSGKPVNKFKVKLDNGKWEQLTTGFIQRINPDLNKLYKALNPLVHPSKEYLDKIYKEDDKSIFLDRTIPTGSISDMGLQNMLKYELDKLTESIDSVIPQSTEYRELEYLDSEMKIKGEAPLIIRIYKY